MVKGADKPLVRPAQYAASIHGETGLDGVDLLPKVLASNLASVPQSISAIAEHILAEPVNTVWIIATGPLTNIALLLRDFPAVRTHIKGLSIMGGAIGDVPTTSHTINGTKAATEPFAPAPPHRQDGKGNWTPHAEFNIWCDPEAAALVFAVLTPLNVPIILIPLDLTHQVRATAEVEQLLFPDPTDPSTNKSIVRPMFKQILLYFASTYSSVSGIHDGPPLHDPLAVFAVLEPDAFDDRGDERWRVNVDTSNGERAGETTAVPLGTDTNGDAIREEGVRIPRSVHLGRFWDAVDNALRAAEDATKNTMT